MNGCACIQNEFMCLTARETITTVTKPFVFIPISLVFHGENLRLKLFSSNYNDFINLLVKLSLQNYHRWQ